MAGQGSKGGGVAQAPNNGAMQPVSGNPQPFNINQYAGQGLINAMDATNYAIAAPLNDGLFMNPYLEEVVDNTAQDIERQRQMAINNIGAQAQGAGAYGGSRQGVVEGVTNAEYGQMAANTLGNLRLQGLNTAMADRNARLNAANQLGGLAGGAFDASRAITSDMLNQGLLQQNNQQALIDAARGDFSNYANYPYAMVDMFGNVINSTPSSTSTTQTNNPGLLGTLGSLMYMFPRTPVG